MRIVFALTTIFTAFGQNQVHELPGWSGDLPWTMYTGYLPTWPECNGNLFYWFTEREGGSNPETPVLIWLNGGPGASSLMGFFVENIGPVNLVDNKLVRNEHAWIDKYNLLIIDNPVGTGFSNTTDMSGCYVTKLEQMGQQFYTGLNVFFSKRHPKFAKNPLWITGESYAGTYIPYIAWELHQHNFPFEGVVIGNGAYDPPNDIMTVPIRFYQEGLLDEHGNANISDLANQCAVKMRTHAADMFELCKYVMTAAMDLAGGVFQYDLRVFSDLFANIGKEMSFYLNQEDVKAAIGTVGNTWSSADEEGPVADALGAEYSQNVTGLLASLLDANYKVITYSGVADGSAYNHLANARALLGLSWKGHVEFAAAKQSPWRISVDNFLGFKRIYQNLAFVMIVNSGHLVPMNQPENFRRFLDSAVSGELFQ